MLRSVDKPRFQAGSHAGSLAALLPPPGLLFRADLGDKGLEGIPRTVLCMMVVIALAARMLPASVPNRKVTCSSSKESQFIDASDEAGTVLASGAPEAL